jgi:hypothetical protein
MIRSIYLFFLLLLITFYSIVPMEMDQSVMTLLIVTIFGSIILFACTKEENIYLDGQFLKHSTLFLLGYCIVHFQYYLDYLLGNVTSSYSFIWVNKSVVIKAMVLSTIGLLCFLIGYLSFKNTFKKKLGTRSEIAVGVNFLLIISLISLITYFVTVNPLYLLGFYGTEQMGSSATYAILIFELAINAIVIQNCRNIIISNNIPINFKSYVHKQGYFLMSIITIYLLSVIISGDRGPIITFGICFSSGYFFVTKNKLSLKKGVFLIFICAIFITFLGIARNMDKELDFSSKLKAAAKEINTNTEVSFLPQTQELAGSVRTLHTTLDYIPAKHDFLYGRFQFQQISGAIPFFSFFDPLFFDDLSFKYKGSSSFITWINQGNFPSSGDGTSCVADFYFDFGLFGVTIGMFLFGYSIRYLEINTLGATVIPTLLVHIFGLVYLCNAVYIPRSSVLFDLKTAVWIYLLLLINKKIFQRK